ncbi:GDP-mannose 4,6-dehydratase [Lysobacter sp. HA35]
MRALIIGHRGQDGRILWQQLAERGFSLVGVSRSGVDLHDSTDVSCTASPAEVVSSLRPDQIYYLAAYHHSAEQDIDPVGISTLSWEVHVHRFEEVLNAVRYNSPKSRVFYASSSRIFGDGEAEIRTESSPWRPQCIYGVTKAAGTALAGYFRRTHGVHASCGILFNHESSFRARHFLSRRVVEGLLDIRDGLAQTLVLGSLDAQVDWGYAPDYTGAMQLILNAPPDDFVIATGDLHSVRDFVAIAARRLGITWEPRVVQRPHLLKRPPQAFCGDAARLRAETGWAPSIDFEAMVIRLVDEAAARRSVRPCKYGSYDAASENQGSWHVDD